jgi:hypothetical protein
MSRGVIKDTDSDVKTLYNEFSKAKRSGQLGASLINC